MDQWLTLLDTVAALQRRQGCQLLVVDSLAQFLPVAGKLLLNAVRIAAHKRLRPLMQ
jgi:hypothetical protein